MWRDTTSLDSNRTSAETASATVRLAGLVPSRIETLFLTGGSAAMPPLRPSTALSAVVGLMAGGLIAARLVDPIPAPLAILVAVGALVGVTLVVARADLGTVLSPPTAVAAVVLGLAIDTGVRVAFGSWDLAWQSGFDSLVVVLALAVGLVALALVTGRVTGTRQVVPTPPAVWVGGGAYFLLQLLFLQNFAFVASQGQVSVAVAAFSVLAADLAAFAIVSRGPSLTRAQVAGVAVVVVVLAWVLPLARGIGAVLAVVALQSLYPPTGS